MLPNRLFDFRNRVEIKITGDFLIEMVDIQNIQANLGVDIIKNT
jgi:hypothetical protein